MARLTETSLSLRGEPTAAKGREAGGEFGGGGEPGDGCKVNVTKVSTNRVEMIFSKARWEWVTKCPPTGVASRSSEFVFSAKGETGGRPSDGALELGRALGRIVGVPGPDMARLGLWKLPPEADLLCFLVPGPPSTSDSRLSIVAIDPADIRLRRREATVRSISSTGCDGSGVELGPGCVKDCVSASRAGKGVRLRIWRAAMCRIRRCNHGHRFRITIHYKKQGQLACSVGS